MKLLGVKIGDHDSNLSLFDGNTVRYHKSERFFQIKHLGFTDPFYWVDVVKRWGVTPDQLDAICIVADQELLDFQFDSSLTYELIPKEHSPFKNITCPIFRLDHHLAHALSVWPIEDYSNIEKTFVFDGDGDFNRSYSIFQNLELIETMTVYQCKSFGTVLEELAVMNYLKGHNLDLSGKAMGLKSYGVPNLEYLEIFENHALNQLDDVFNHSFWIAVTQDENPRNFLATVHKFVEDKFPQFFASKIGSDSKICFTGGVAQNSVINGKLQKIFPNLIIPPHCTDDGLSLGCLEFLRQHFDLNAFKFDRFPYCQDDIAPETPSIETIRRVAELLAENKIVAWYQGHGEIGPRALGNRSILMSPLVKDGKDVINSKVKKREWFRPFGCSIIKGYQKDYFDVEYDSPYMLHVVDVKDKEQFPSITHEDGTTRFQTVDESNPVFLSLLNEFMAITGCPLLLNTSLNVNMFPIANSESDAMKLYETTKVDAICIGNRILVK
jgi:carbamoyltransferase